MKDVFTLVKNIVLYLFLWLLVACSATNTVEMDGVASVNLTNLAVNNISIRANEEDILKVFGEPDHIEQIENPKSFIYIYGRNKDEYDLDVRTVNGKVSRFFIASNMYELNNDITVGDSLENVMKSFGEDYYRRTDTGSQIVGYIDKENGINIEFGIVDNKIKGIIVKKIAKRL